MRPEQEYFESRNPELCAFIKVNLSAAKWHALLDIIGMYKPQEGEKIISSNHVLSAVRPAVSWFGTRMEAKLAVNDHKPNWNTQTMEYLHERLGQEADELYNAFRYYNSLPPDVPNDKAREKAIDECADVANFAMMIADNLLEDGKHGR